jgi:hypothetical protein
MSEQVEGRLIGVVSGCTNPESVELLPDGETVVFGNCRLNVGYPWFRGGSGLVYLQGAAFVSQARLKADGFELTERELVTGLTGTLGCDVLRNAPTERFAVGTVFMCEGGKPLTADEQQLVTDADPGVIAFDGMTGEVRGRIPMGSDSELGRAFNGLEQPNGLAIDSSGNLYVGDIPNTNPDPDPDAPPPVPPAVYRIPNAALDALAAGIAGAAESIRRVVMPNYVNGITVSPIDQVAYAVSCMYNDPVEGGVYRLDDDAFASGEQPAPIRSGFGIQDGVAVTRRGTVLISNPLTGRILGFRADGSDVEVVAAGLPTRMPADFNVVYPPFLNGEPALLITDISVGSPPGDATVSAVAIEGL